MRRSFTGVKIEASTASGEENEVKKARRAEGKVYNRSN